MHDLELAFACFEFLGIAHPPLWPVCSHFMRQLWERFFLHRAANPKHLAPAEPLNARYFEAGDI